MIRNKLNFVLAVSFLIGIGGVALNSVYYIEEDGVLNEDLKSSFYDQVSPFWNTVILPIQDTWCSLWPERLVNSNFGILIVFLFWALFGLVASVVISFIWSKLRYGAKAK